MSKTKVIVISCIVSFLVGSVATFAICKGRSDRLIDAMSKQLTESQATNERITEENSRLAELNRQSTETISGLEKQLADSYRQSQETIDGIRGAIGEAARGLENAGSDIDATIAGIEAIKKLIQSLP